jgi:hypothetical protein
VKTSRTIRRAALTLLTVMILASAVPALAQSCALCYTQAASSGRQMIEALRSGILILVIPPTPGAIKFAALTHTDPAWTGRR